ncbi:hypothetical protein A2480_03025 [Candidatus Uhrbacteria bacterium RIFOXYC2_FULL_47_19]|uniref:GIY-YIG domain-containing protein n=1 Tax=Candidatus Uhrbacteria bacterium RIFOXYC2_FULL_47_19 TaxID=1802424 RepID=A0A1F7WDT1_9BACT|nr:MAG: hypothetical protein A2480_03025 [Candidatus Uhrbacteria bacterium RIFOXYC2_FULL_47_19]
MGFTYVYVLVSGRDGKFYVGQTNDLRRRLRQHQSGMNRSTAGRLPVMLVFYEAYLSKGDALRRERYFKTTKGKVTLRAMLADYLKSGTVRN